MLENQTPEHVLEYRGGRVLQTNKMSTPQVDLTPKNRATKHFRQKLSETQGEIDESTVATRDF